MPEAAFSTGDFSSAPTRIYDPATGNANGTGRTQFANNQIPAESHQPDRTGVSSTRFRCRISRAQQLGQTNYEQTYVERSERRRATSRLRISWRQNDLVNVRYSRQNASTLDPATFGIYGGLKPFAGTGTNPTQSFGATYNRVWSATLVQEIRFGRTHHHNEAICEDYGLTTSQDFGIRGVNLNEFTSGITTINVGGYSDYLIGFETSLPWDREESTWTFATTATKMWGNHTLKVGGDLRMNRHLLDQMSHPRASWSFRGAQTALDTDTTAVNGYANSLASFMLDVPNFIEVTERGVVNEQLHRGGTHKVSTRTFTTSGSCGRTSLLILVFATSCTSRSLAVHARRRTDDL